MSSNPWDNGLPDYFEEMKKRIERLNSIKNNPQMELGAYEYYRDKPAEFINDWVMTYDPRTEIKIVPFILFMRQIEFIEFLHECFLDGEAGLVEKSRDVGASWLCCAFAVWMFIYIPDSSIGFGSQLERKVDKLGDRDTLLEKIRIIFRNLPRFFLPQGFCLDSNMGFMNIVSQSNGCLIKGDCGDGIGRGGRSTCYIKDESAHYLHQDLIDASLSANTDVQIDISSVNGTANLFYRRRMAGQLWTRGHTIPSGVTRVFIFDWRDNPLKDEEWYNKKRAKAEEEGVLHLFAQEVDRDYAASVVGVVIPAKHVKAAIDAHIKLGFEAEGLKTAALDVADEEGVDTNALAIGQGVVLLSAREWGGLDTTKTAQEAVDDCILHGVSELYYDCLGVGAGVRGETNRLKSTKERGEINFNILPWNAALSGKSLPNAEKYVIKGDSKSPKNKDFYASMKSMAWWSMRLRFEKTYKAVTQGIEYDPEELISIPSTIENRHKIEQELSQATWSKSQSTGKILINKQPNGVPSPNIADSIVMRYFPPAVNIEFHIM